MIQMKKYKTVVILFLSLFLVVCSKTKNPIKNPPANPKFESSQSKCKGSLNPGMARSANSDTVIFSSNGDTILVIHQNAFYNCCSKIEVKVTQTQEGFDLAESDTGLPCDCPCLFDIATIISGLSPGSYLIRVFDIDSNLVGSGVVDLPPKYTGFESSQSECKEGWGKINAETSSQDTLGDSIAVWSRGDTAWVAHKNAFYNCCSVIMTSVERTTEGFNLYEDDIAVDLCHCMCYFDITTTIYGLSPGTYLIRVFDTGGDLVGEVEMVIPYP
jgi:uncharacterized protein (DUF2141 family)